MTKLPVSLKLSSTIKYLLITATFIAGLFATSFVAFAAGRIHYATGYYTNIYGSGTAADKYTGEADCDPEDGYCNPKDGEYLFAFICDGEVDECTNGDTESIPLSSSLNVTDSYKQRFHNNKEIKAECDQTIQIDVFTHNCREDGGWSCGADDIKGYLVWYNSCEEVEETPPVCSLTANPLSGTTPLTVDFDASGSFDTDGSIIEYIWNIAGEAITTTVPTLKRTFSADGTYEVSLAVKDNSEQVSSNECAVSVVSSSFETPDDDNLPPVCVIASATPASGSSPLEVTFDGSQSFDPDGDAISFLWEFGDGSNSTNQNPVHTYLGSAITYTATLVVTDEYSLSSAVCSAVVSLDEEPEDNDDDGDTDDDDDDEEEDDSEDDDNDDSDSDDEDEDQNSEDDDDKKIGGKEEKKKEKKSSNLLTQLPITGPLSTKTMSLIGITTITLGVAWKIYNKKYLVEEE